MSRGSENPSTNLALTPALDVPSLPAGHHDHRTLRRLPPLQSIYAVDTWSTVAASNYDRRRSDRPHTQVLCIS